MRRGRTCTRGLSSGVGGGGGLVVVVAAAVGGLLLAALGVCATMQPAAAAVRRIELPAGCLVGFKAAPGASCEKLFKHATESFLAGASDPQESPTPDWSGIYVQLGIEQAIRYVPNQFDRGEPLVSVVALRVRQGQSLRVVAVTDTRMADTAISSADKASIVRDHVTASGHDLGSTAPLLMALGQVGQALCLLDSEDYELAVPHALFSEVLFEAETLMTVKESQRLPSTVGQVVPTPGTAAQSAIEAVVSTMSKGDLSDVSGLSCALKDSMDAHGVPSGVDWLQTGGGA
jgi:hypothetical protein